MNSIEVGDAESVKMNITDANTETSNPVIRSLLILIAMEQEAADFVQHFALVEQQMVQFPLAQIPAKQYHKRYVKNVDASDEWIDIYVVTNGRDERFDCNNVGTTPAAISTFAAITTIRPDVVINAGTAGGFYRVGGNIGDVYICNYFTHHDRRIPLTADEIEAQQAQQRYWQQNRTHKHVKADMKIVEIETKPKSEVGVKFHDYGFGKHQQLQLGALVEELQCKMGNVSTSNSLDHTERDDEFMLENNAHVKDMEAAAIAWVIENCYSKNGETLPFFAIKVVTDIVDGTKATETEFLSNLHVASKKLSDTLINTVEFMCNKRLSEL